MTQQIQLNPKTVLKFNGEASGVAAAFSLEGLLNGAGRVAAQYDLTAGVKDFQFSWMGFTQWQATPTQYGALEFYVASALDGYASKISGDVGASDAALGDLDQLRNLQPIGSIVAEKADTTLMISDLQHFTFTGRYLTVVAVNNGGATLHATDANSAFLLMPFNLQGQAT